MINHHGYLVGRTTRDLRSRPRLCVDFDLGGNLTSGALALSSVKWSETLLPFKCHSLFFWAWVSVTVLGMLVTLQYRNEKLNFSFSHYWLTSSPLFGILIGKVGIMILITQGSINSCVCRGFGGTSKLSTHNSQKSPQIHNMVAGCWKTSCSLEVHTWGEAESWKAHQPSLLLLIWLCLLSCTKPLFFGWYLPQVRHWRRS